MAWETLLRDEVATLVEATWTDLDLIRRERTAARINWRALVETLDRESGEMLPTRFAVIEFGDKRLSSDFSDHSEVYEYPLAIYYIMRAQTGVGVAMTETDVEDLLIARAESLQDALNADGENFQVTGSSTSRSAAIPPNAYFLRAKMDFYAVQVTATLICGPVTP